jgi:gluconolactonase
MRYEAALLLFVACLPAQSIPESDFPKLRNVKIGSGFGFLEGPVWHPSGYLLFSDIPNNRIHKLTPGKPIEVFRENSGGANGLALDDKGRLHACEGGARRVTRTDAKGAVESIAEKFEGKRLNSPNDIAVRKDGHVYFTDPAYGKAEDTRELPFFGLFHINPKGELAVVARFDKRPNGIALSPNNRLLYVAGADERVIRVFDLDRSGAATNARILISNIDGPPDGIRTDNKGNIWAAANKVVVYSPEGKLLHSIELAERPANLAFGDDGQSVYVTARTSLYRIRAEQPEANNK